MYNTQPIPKKLSTGILVLSISILLLPSRVISQDTALVQAKQLAETALSYTTISAKGVFVGVYNPDTDTVDSWYEKNANESYNAASLTKIATALTVLGDVPTNRTIRKLAPVPSILADFPVITTNVDTLLRAALVQSSNRAAYSLAVTDSKSVERFVEKMQDTADSIGITSAQFSDPSGYDFRDPARASYLSPRDAAVLALALYQQYPRYARASVVPSFTVRDPKDKTKVYTFRNTNPLVATIPQARVSKTGFTQLAGGNLVMVFETDTGGVVTVALLASTPNARFGDMRRIWSVVQSSISASYYSLAQQSTARVQ